MGGVAVLRQLNPGADHALGLLLEELGVLGIAGVAGDLAHGTDGDDAFQRQVDAVRDRTGEVVGLVLELGIERVRGCHAGGNGGQIGRPLVEDRVVRVGVGRRFGLADMLHVGVGHDQHVGGFFHRHVLAAAIVMPGRVRVGRTYVVRRVDLGPLPRF